MNTFDDKRENSGRVLETRVGADVAVSPEISVVIPAYNCADYIADCVSAALSQTHENYEVIVVNDGSDDTVKLESELEPFISAITYVVRENGGPGAARNSGIRVSRGEYLGFVDGDDVWYPEFLSEQLAVLKSEDCDMVYCDALLFGDVEKEDQTFAQKAPSSGPVTTESLISGTCNVILSGTFVKKESLIAVGLFRESGLEIAIEDYELWFRLAKNGVRIHCNPKILLRYRVHKTNISGTMLRIVERGLYGTRFLRDNFGLNESERAAVIEREKQINSQYLIEKAKIHLAHNRFEESVVCFEAGAVDSDNKKLKMLRILLKFSPSATRNLFKMFRRKEFENALNEDIAA